MARALLAAGLADRRPDALVRSGGFLVDGRPADPHAVAALAELGLDISGHRSRRLTADDVAGADLLFTMGREHVRRLVANDPDVWPRTFTVKEFVRRARQVGPLPAGTSVADWLELVGAGRTTRQLLGADDGDDVADPIGGSLDVFRSTAAELRFWCGHAVDLLAEVSPAR
jgi:protein-tyrosine phosphatase